MRQTIRAKFYIPLLMLMLMSISISAQKQRGEIAGKVIDEAGEPMLNATVFIEELKKGAVTDGNGKFSFTDLPFANYTITVKFVGYQTLTKKVNVEHSRNKHLHNLTLQEQTSHITD